MKKLFTLIIFVLFLSGLLFAEGYKEKDYQKKFVTYLEKNYYGKIETNKRLEGRTEADILTKEYAIEVDWGEKWYQAIGLSLHYGLVSRRKPGILLILKKGGKNNIYLKRLINVIVKYDLNFHLWTIDLDFKVSEVQYPKRKPMPKK